MQLIIIIVLTVGILVYPARGGLALLNKGRLLQSPGNKDYNH